LSLQRVVSSDGVSLAVREEGDPARPTVILIHGYPQTKEMWEAVSARLASDFHVVAYDVRGAGHSDAPSSAAAYDFERLADDFSAVVAAVAPGKAVHLVGHDWGALQGWEFATSPRLGDRLASFTAVAGPSLDQVAIASRSPRRLMSAWRSWYILLLLSPGGPRVMSRMVRAGGGPPGAQPSLADDVVRGAWLYRRNIPRRLRRPRRDAVAHVPVQLIIPRGDRYIPPSYYALAGEYAPRLVRREVDGPHWLPGTHPDLVAGWVASFIEEVS
jgi:pimeloyl-ACP methyl ester carboxylesterase